MMERRLILCTGLYRSGSTLQFNIVRIILEQLYGTGEVYSEFINDYIKSSPKKFHLIKTHAEKEDLANKATLIFTSVRDREGVVKSISRVNQLGNLHLKKERADSYFQSWWWWCGRADFIQSYKEIKSLDNLVKRYIHYFETQINSGNLPQGNPLEFNHIMEQYEREVVNPIIKKNTHQPKTLLHNKHRGEW